MPPDPLAAVTWMFPAPLPDVGKTVILGAFEDAVQLPGMPLRKFTATVWVLVISVGVYPKLSFGRFTDNVPRIVIVVVSLVLAPGDPPPDTPARLTCGEGAFTATFTDTIMGG